MNARSSISEKAGVIVTSISNPTAAFQQHSNSEEIEASSPCFNENNPEFFQEVLEKVKTTFVPYLNFDGNCREAMEFYHSVLGGKLTMQTIGEAFPDTPEEIKGRIMHAAIQHETLSLMASDTHPIYSPPFVAGNNIHLCIVGSNAKQITEHFEKLSEGGKVNMPLEKQFWGDTYGSLTDKFGVHWMVDIASEEQ